MSESQAQAVTASSTRLPMPRPRNAGRVTTFVRYPIAENPAIGLGIFSITPTNACETISPSTSATQTTHRPVSMPPEAILANASPKSSRRAAPSGASSNVHSRRSSASAGTSAIVTRRTFAPSIPCTLAVSRPTASLPPSPRGTPVSLHERHRRKRYGWVTGARRFSADACWPPPGSVEALLSRDEPVGDERLHGIRRAADELRHVVLGRKRREHVVGHRPRIAALRPPDPDPQPLELRGSQCLRDRTQAVVPCEPPAEPRLEPAERQVDVVVHDEHVLGPDLEEAGGGCDRPPRLVHVRLGLEHGDAHVVDARLGEPAAELRPKRARVPSGELVRDHPPHVVTIPCVFGAGVAQSRDEQLERRGGLAPTKEPHELLLVGFGGLARFGRLALLRRLALLALFAGLGQSFRLCLGGGLGFRLFELGERTGHGDADDHGFVRVVEERHTLRRAYVLEAEDVTDVERRDVDVDVVGHVHRQRLDVELALHERDHASALCALGLSHEVDDDRSLDRLVEPHLAEVDVRDRPADRILLVVGENRRVHRLLAFEDDVENGVESRRATHRSAQRPLGDCDRARLTVAVEHAGDDPLRAKAAGMARATLLALTHLELDPVAGHGGG